MGFLFILKDCLVNKCAYFGSILLYVFDNDFFTRDLKLKDDQVVGFLEHIDKNLPSQKLLKVDKQFELIDYLISESQSYRAQF